MTLRSVIGLIAAMSAGALVVGTAPAQLASEHVAGGSRPPPGSIFEGRFSGSGSAYSAVEIDTGVAGLAIRGMSGLLPGPCTVRGQLRVPVRDGAIGILFNLWDKGKATGSRAITQDGTFSLRYDHRADVLNNATYTVWIRGTFSGSRVHGRVKGVLKSDFDGTCRSERSFTAKRRTS